MKKQTGLSLVDLVVVAAISGVLATIAIPAYQDHATGAIVTEALGLSPEARQAVGEAFHRGGRYVAVNKESDATPVAAGISDSHVSRETAIAMTGNIRIEFRRLAREQSGNRDTVGISPVTVESDETAWACSGEGIEAGFVPGICR